MKKLQFKSFSKSALVLATISVATLASCSKDEVSENMTQPTANQAPAQQERGTGEYIIVTKDGNVESLLAETGIEALNYGKGNNLAAIAKGFTAKLNATQLAALRNDSRIDYIEEDRIVYPAMSDGISTTIKTTQQISWGVKKIGGAGNGVGKTAWIIDSGIDPNHSDLNVDKTRSKSFLASTQGADYKSYADAFGHGTQVAGIIGAKNNGYGTVGVAAGATLVSLRVMDARGAALVSKITAALNHVAYYGKAGDVVNLSIGFGASSTVDAAVQKVAAKGIFVAIASGNSNADAKNYSPARVNGTNIYTVSSMNNSNVFISGANFGATTVDYAAPGTNIATTAKGGGYVLFGGTSSAAPHMAGVLLVTGGKPRANGLVSGDKDGKPDPILSR